MSKAKGYAAGVRGMNQAYNAATQDWKDRAMSALLMVIARIPEFTTDMVWAEDPSLDDGVTENRSMGGVMTAARKAGLIEVTSRYEPSNREVSHHRPLRIWSVQ